MLTGLADYEDFSDAFAVSGAMTVAALKPDPDRLVIAVAIPQLTSTGIVLVFKGGKVDFNVPMSVGETRLFKWTDYVSLTTRGMDIVNASGVGTVYVYWVRFRGE